MAVESTAGGVAVTGEHINFVRARAALSALGLEIRTGMRMSRGMQAFDAVNGWLDRFEQPTVPGSRTVVNKRKAYVALRAYLIEQGYPVNDERTMGDQL